MFFLLYMLYIAIHTFHISSLILAGQTKNYILFFFFSIYTYANFFPPLVKKKKLTYVHITRSSILLLLLLVFFLTLQRLSSPFNFIHNHTLFFTTLTL
ncbi:hypothetical protein BDA99DRAFT_169427 [Phascolomyces articulosus]|uniref:Uncharacterized protein n=1 Tax=Phascolomyces articulosus TaxID=60185 RepID=A0AAD5K350_9FUNG|nr:hypothetical protein BDA99DRAFT_169427 [Phascolomyces articulosus]